MSYYRGRTGPEFKRNRSNPWFARQNHVKLPKYLLSPTYVDTQLGWTPTELFANGEVGGYYSFDPGTVFQDVDDTIQATPGDPVASVLDLSGNASSLVQSTLTQRPIYTRHPKNGVRNLLDDSENFPAWSLVETGGIVTDVVSASGRPGIHVETASARAYYTKPFTFEPSTTYTLSVRLDPGWSVQGGIVAVTGLSDATGTITGTQNHVVNNVCSITFTTGVEVNGNVRVGGGVTTTATVDAVLSGAQLEVGAATTAYQSRVSQYDVTEQGVPDVYGLTLDGIDDALESAATIDLTGTDSATMALGMQMLRFGEINQQYLVHNRDLSPYLVMHHFWAETDYLIKTDTDISGTGVGHGNVSVPTSQIARFSPGDMDLLVNGVEADKPASTQNGNFGNGYLNLGRRDDTFAFTEMLCYETLLIDRAITDEEREQLQDYLLDHTAGATL